MRRAFTLIELLVVVVILILVMAMIAPKGAKMLGAFERSMKNTKDKQKLSYERSDAFLQAREKNIDILGASYRISSKGVITQYEKSNDNN